MRLAVKDGKPLSYVLSEYPAWELNYWKAWYSYEPTDGQRVERISAHLTALTANLHRSKGQKPMEPSGLMMPDLWLEKNKAVELEKETDIEMMIREFKAAGFAVNTRKPE